MDLLSSMTRALLLLTRLSTFYMSLVDALQYLAFTRPPNKHHLCLSIDVLIHAWSPRASLHDSQTYSQMYLWYFGSWFTTTCLSLSWSGRSWVLIGLTTHFRLLRFSWSKLSLLVIQKTRYDISVQCRTLVSRCCDIVAIRVLWMLLLIPVVFTIFCVGFIIYRSSLLWYVVITSLTCICPPTRFNINTQNI